MFLSRPSFLMLLLLDILNEDFHLSVLQLKQVMLLGCLSHLTRFFGFCYAMDGGYKGCNPYIERHLAIFVNYFCSRAN